VAHAFGRACLDTIRNLAMRSMNAGLERARAA
jgi:hypothetical protein